MNLRFLVLLFSIFTASVLITACGGSDSSTSTNSTNPEILSISPSSFQAGDVVTINGSRFGASQDSSYVTLGSIKVNTFTSWSNTAVAFVAPAGIAAGLAKVYVNETASNGFSYSISKYSTITINNVVWMRTNLDVTTYQNGETIPQVKDASVWAGLTTGAWRYYSNSTANGTVYGKLYNWYAVNDSRGLAPNGYHVATRAEWTSLGTYLGGNSSAGGKLKSTSSSYWVTPNLATNESQFSALGGGYCKEDGAFYHFQEYANFWTATDYYLSCAYCAYLQASSEELFLSNGNNKKCGFSVRCVKN